MESRNRLRVEHLDVGGVLKLLEAQGFGEEFQLFVREKDLDGLRLMGVTEGILKLWRPKMNAKNFLNFIEDLQKNPNRYFDDKTIQQIDVDYIDKEAITIARSIECQYQTVNVKKIRKEVFTTTSLAQVEDILKKLVPTKSFLYPDQSQKKTPEKSISSYVPMDVGKKPRRFFSFSYDNQHFDLKKFKFYKNEKFNDRGYYAIKNAVETENKNKLYKNRDVETIELSVEKEIIDSESTDIVLEDHFYEDLCYNDIKDNKTLERSSSMDEASSKIPRLTKIHDMFSTIKLPFFKRGVETSKKKEKEEVQDNKNKDECAKKVEINLVREEVNTGIVYENASECCSNMYDSVQIRSSEKFRVDNVSPAAVSDYLEPIRLPKDYCDVTLPKAKDESFLGFIMSIFGSHFGMSRETSDPSEDSSYEKPLQSPIHKWSEHRKSRGNMAARPLPVPVDHEPYYMRIDRSEAEALLAGQPDGSFILRPSSQPNHVYSLTVACSNDVHNVGIRRRPDGRLALGFARKGERSFSTISSLLRYHRRRRLLLVAAQGVVGATVLKEPPVYYQTPSSLPVQTLARPSSVL